MEPTKRIRVDAKHGTAFSQNNSSAHHGVRKKEKDKEEEL
jgi:hypothetical protein